MGDPNGYRHSKGQANPREYTECPIGQTARPEAAVRFGYQHARPLTAARSIACRMAYGKILLVGRSW